MSLTVSAKSAGIDPIAEGTYIAICYGMIDIGDQYSEKYEKSTRKIIILWEVPSETIEIDGEEKRRTISKTYTASIGKKANLRKDLVCWRGREFTQAEEDAFNLANIVGKGCMIQIVHTKTEKGTYANIAGLLALPKGTKVDPPENPLMVFDLDEDDLGKMNALPEWIQEKIKASETYKERSAESPRQPTDIDEDGEGEEVLPF